MDLRKPISRFVLKIPIDLRTYFFPFLYGLLGGLAAVAFQKAAATIFSLFFESPSRTLPWRQFAASSLFTILTASLISGLILAFVSREAARTAYGADLGEARDG